MTDKWTPGQFGKAAAAVTAPGETPRYGLAYDLATAQWETAAQFQQFARDAVAQTQQAQIQATLAQQNPAAHDLELEKATNYQSVGQFMPDGSFQNDEHRGGIGGFFDSVKTGLNMAGSELGGEAKELVSSPAGAADVLFGGLVGGYTDSSGGAPDDSDQLFTEYTRNQGLLTQDEFMSFDLKTQQKLWQEAKGGHNLHDIAQTPGIKQGLEGIATGYRGLVTAGNMYDASLQRDKTGFEAPVVGNIFKTVTDPNWWKQDKWSQAWRASQDRSLGNAIVDSAFAPYKTPEQLDEWRRNSSIYQLSSTGAELGAGWFIDPLVVTNKGVGSLARLAKGEMPLNEGGAVFKATTQALQREKITVGGPVAPYARWRAGKISAKWDDVVKYAQENPLAEFSQLPMFKKRAIDGQPAAYALHYAANSDSPALLDLTQQLLHGDPKAFEKLASLKRETPDALVKFAPGAQTFIDAVDATKTRIGQLEREIADLDRLDIKSPFHDWSLHAERDAKVRDIDEATNALHGYEGYGAWLDSLGTPEEALAGAGKAFPLVAQVNVPAIKTWSATARRTGAPGTSRFFMDNQYGFAHTIREIPRSVWIEKANTVEMHNINTGAMSIQRQFAQFDHLFGYRNPEALDGAINAWHRATNATERYEVVRNLEETHLIGAAAQHFGVDREVIQAVYQKVVDEQNKMIRAIRQGDSTIYSSAPTLGERLESGNDESIRLLQRSEDGNTVQVELMNGKHRTTATVHASALTEKAKPIDPTQTPNYYNPLDTRRFKIELKRNKDLLTELHKGRIARGGAWTMDEVDQWGQRFNALWKPLQLFRLGWPQRVLMDEGLRALAVLGPADWFSAHGADAMAMGRNALSYPLRTATISKRFGVNRDLNIGDGPLAREAYQSSDPFARDREVIEAAHVPESLVPEPNAERLIAAMRHVSNQSEWKRLSDRARANGTNSVGPQPFHPIRQAVDAHRANREAGLFDSMAFDPLSGRPVTKGFVIPLPHTRTNLHSPESVVNPGAEHWYEKHAEMLSSPGYRVAIDPDGNMTVGRWFSSQRRRKAEDFLRYIDDGVGRDLGSGADFTARVEEDTALHARMMDEARAEDEARTRALLANGDLRAQEIAAGDTSPDFSQFDFQIDSAVQRAYRQLAKRRETGRGLLVSRSADGKVINSRAAYEGHEGEMLRALTSSNKTIDAISEGHGRALSMLRRKAVGHRVYSPPAFTEKALEAGSKENAKAVEYFQRWSDMVNDQIGNSPVWGKMLHGWSDEKIVNWLSTTPAGAAVRREVMHEGRDVDLWVNEHRAKLNYYLPNQQLQRLLGKGRIDASMLRRHVHNDDLPDVFGPDFEVLDKRVGAGQLLNIAADRIWHTLGTVPIDALSRHPFARAMYNVKMRSLVGSHDSHWLDEAAVARFEEQSRRFALEQTRRHLWDLTDTTNFTDALRFIAPFWGAQQEAILKWGRIVADRPETVGRFFMGQRAVYKNFQVVDEDGQPVHRDGLFYHPTDRIVMRVPSFMQHGPLGKALMTIGAVGVPLGSANTVLQGEMPLFPGPGPLLTIPADKLLRTFSDTAGVEYDDKLLYRWLFPIGRPQHGGARGILDQMLPGWGKRVMSMNEGSDGVAGANLYTSVAREMQLDNKKKGLPPPTPEEIQKQTKWLWGLRIVAGLVAPVQTEFRPKHQFLIDAAHKYQKDYGQQWFDKFMEDYGTSVASYTAASSNSIIGIPPTSEGMEDWSSNKKLIAQYPEWGSAIISPDAYTDDFSSDAYYAQFGINLGPGDSRKLRDSMSPQERLRKADTQAGWYEYRKFNSVIDAQLSALGATSLQQSSIPGVTQLNDLKHAFVSDLTKRNPAWRDDYDTFSNDIYTRIGELEKFVGNKTFDNRPDIQGVRQYLLIRDKAAQILDANAAQGGSRSLQATTDPVSTQLRNWFYDQVGQLIQSNPAFGEFYTRWLDGDTLTQGSGN